MNIESYLWADIRNLTTTNENKEVNNGGKSRPYCPSPKKAFSVYGIIWILLIRDCLTFFHLVFKYCNNINWVEITYGFPNILFLIKSIILGQLTLFYSVSNSHQSNIQF